MKTLHTAYRVTDLVASLEFYTALGYREVGRVGLDDGATLTMLKFPREEVVTLELVHRPGDGTVQIGTGFSHLVVQVDDLASTLAELLRGGLQAGTRGTSRGSGRPTHLLAHRPGWLPDRTGAVAGWTRRRDQRRRLPLNPRQSADRAHLPNEEYVDHHRPVLTEAVGV